MIDYIFLLLVVIFMLRAIQSLRLRKQEIGYIQSLEEKVDNLYKLLEDCIKDRIKLKSQLLEDD